MDELLSILNVGAGKTLPLDFYDWEEYFLVNLDPMYADGITLSDVEDRARRFEAEASDNPTQQLIIYCSEGWKDFLLDYKYVFDKIVVYRFLEHISMVDVPFFIYALANNLETGSVLEGIVPDYENLCQRILKEDVNDIDFPAQNILHTTELLNEPYDPHGSIWTAQRLKYFFELEGRFKITKIEPNFQFDGRNIYLHFEAERI